LPTLRGEALKLPPKNGAPDEADRPATEAWLARQPRPWAIDVFCGAGGLSLGLGAAGFSVVAGADVDAAAVETHRAAVGSLCYEGDLTDPQPFLNYLAAWRIDHVELVAGAPPCQPFSRAAASKIRSLVATGNREATDPRVDLWESFAPIVDALEPRAVLLENVPDLARWNDGSVLLGLLGALRARGYRADARILESSRYGVPQHRARLFLVALKRGSFSWPNAVARVTVGDAISDLPKVAAGQQELELAYTGASTSFQRRARRGVSRRQAAIIFDHVTRDVRRDDAEAFERLAPGGTYADLPKRLQRYRSDIFTDKYKRLAFDDVSRTITAHIAKDGYWYIHPDQTRTLSIREAARLQTFPDWVRFAGHRTVQLRQIGNAVPPALARAVGRRVVVALQNEVPARRPAEQTEFVEPVLSWHALHARSYPWRRLRDPWLVLVSELALRRTRADQVATIHDEICRIAATPEAARRNARELRAAMESLGLHWRTENVLAVAQELCNRFDGNVPRDEANLRSLPGVGHYVASAVRCFAFGERAVLLDTNTERIVRRVTGRRRGGRWETRLDIYRLAGDEGPTPRLNLALLDFGALVCRSSRPACGTCPIRTYCVMGRQRQVRGQRVGALNGEGRTQEAEPQLLSKGVDVARKTVFVSDLTGKEIDERNAAQLVINYRDARRGRVVLDVNADEVEDLARKGTKQARRGRRPRDASST
jgi:DNA (cytosine-5)-methyltransferase 1